jgi:hypothetical protein
MSRPAAIEEAIFGIACNEFTYGRSDEGVLFALPVNGPRIPLEVKGGPDSLRPLIATMFMSQAGRAPSTTALANVMLACESWAAHESPRRLSQRVATMEGKLYIDLGEPGATTAVRIGPDGWKIVDEPHPDILFRRTKLTSTLPRPTQGDFQDFRRFVNMNDEQWQQLVAWMIGALFDIPRPVLLLTGEQGSAKTTTAGFIIGVLDPSPARCLRAPANEDEWMGEARSQHVVAIDNLSNIARWFSDALCRASTDDGQVKRALYTNSDLIVYSFHCAVILNGIGVAAVRGDLIDRLVTVELDRLSPECRKPVQELRAAFDEQLPALLAGFYDLAVQVLGRRNDVRLDTSPRMVDYARVLAALDLATGWRTLPGYVAMTERGFEDALEGSSVAQAVVEFMQNRDKWTGTATELLGLITPPPPTPKTWPTHANHLASDLGRSETILRTAGIAIKRTRSGSQRLITLTKR